jgi:hypothetical protein
MICGSTVLRGPFEAINSLDPLDDPVPTGKRLVPLVLA